MVESKESVQYLVFLRESVTEGLEGDGLDMWMNVDMGMRGLREENFIFMYRLKITSSLKNIRPTVRENGRVPEKRTLGGWDKRCNLKEDKRT